ncbi:MAG: D-alanine--D-alanine ligase family protein [Dehalococcoidia bacterium]|nr:D-alanine--D-alanine ligase family protein [Dehalococcoidia bacterium]
MAVGRLRVGILFGGMSGEHEISLLSARSVMLAIDREKYVVVPIGITKEGEWIIQGDPMNALVGRAEEDRQAVGDRRRTLARASVLPNPFPRVDVVFPLLHGPFGEDGTVQGLLEMAQIPYVGAGVLASALGMDKAHMKAVFQQQGLPVARFVAIRREEWGRDREASLTRSGTQSYPLFVKPANGGSSVGISKVASPKDLPGALELAFRYDRKAVLEEAIEGREIECSVLGNDDPQVSVPGEVVHGNDFYDYEAKYSDPRTRLVVPAPLDENLVSRFQELALAAFRAIDCCGMARVDFFLRHTDKAILVSEINTIPGFTPMSMYPRLWEASGMTFPELIARLIQLGLEKHGNKRGI